MANLLITGASGLLGSNLAYMARKIYDVVAVSYRSETRFPGVRQVNCDLTVSGEAARIIDSTEPEWIVHCAAISDVDACEENPARAIEVNSDLPRTIAKLAERHEAGLVHVSTDAVFDGTSPVYNEDDIPNPINVYGRTKLAGEFAVREECPTALVLRTNFYGWNMQPKHSLAEWFLEGFLEGDIRNGFIDVRVSPLLVNDLVDWILKLMDEQQQGVFHLSSQDCMSKFEFGKLIAATYGLNETLCRPVKVEEAGLKARRPKNLCLDSWKASTALGMQPFLIAEGIARFKSLGDQDYPNALKECLV